MSLVAAALIASVALIMWALSSGTAPQIPYIDVGELDLDFLRHLPIIGDSIDPADPPSIKPFGTLVAIGVYLGTVLAVRHGRERGIDPKRQNEFMFWCLAGGFIGAHVLDAIFYNPHKIVEDPLYLLKIWAGLSSFGGFTGAAVGAFLWKWSRRRNIMPYLDMVTSIFPFAWMFGRAGCATVHDHPGRLSDSWLAVQWPQGNGFVGRFDLGLLEMLYTIPIAILFFWLWRKPRPTGYFSSLICVLYAPVRFGLDFLRVSEGSLAGADPRYFGLTPAQWASFVMFAVGLTIFLKVRTNAPVTDYGELTEAESTLPSDETARRVQPTDQGGVPLRDLAERRRKRKAGAKKRRGKTPKKVGPVEQPE